MKMIRLLILARTTLGSLIFGPMEEDADEFITSADIQVSRFLI